MGFVKCIIVGTAIGTAVGMMYSEGTINKKKLLKQGRKLVKKIGI